MDKGVTYTFPATAYPRYRYFQQRLHGLIPRLQRILEAGGLPDCISQGREKLKKISSSAQEVSDNVTVSLFADDGVLDSGKVDLSVQCQSMQKESVAKSRDVQKESEAKSRDMQKESVAKSRDVQKESEAKSRDVQKESEAKSRDVQKESVSRSRDVQKESVSRSRDVQKESVSRSRDVKKESVSWSSYLKATEDMSNLTPTATVIVAYTKEVITELSGLSEAQLMNVIIYNDKTNTNCLFTNLVNADTQEAEETKESKERSKYLGKQIQHLLEEKAITVLEMIVEYIRVFIPKQEEEVDNSLLDEINKELMDSLKDEYVVKDLAPDIEDGVQNKMNVERDEQFQRRLANFVAKKTKCVVCNNLSKKYGIASCLVNDFLNAGFCNYEAKITERLKTIGLPKWPRDRSETGVAECRLFSYSCGENLAKILHSTEDYIKDNLQILTVMKKLRFEIFGLFLQTDVPVYTVIPAVQKLALELQYELIKLPEVHGCGTCFGELVLHVTTTLSPSSKDEIKDLLSKYHYTQGFKSELMEMSKKTANAMLHVEQGQELRAKKRDSSRHSFGSLGCFVHIKPKDVPSQSKSEPGSKVSSAFVITESKVHCITCAHCVANCEDEVDVKQGNTYRVLGHRKIELYQPEAFDVASIQIQDRYLPYCDTSLRNMEERKVLNWKFYDGDPLMRRVQKRGCATGFTTGIIMCSNNVTKQIEILNGLQGRNDGRFGKSYNILIESLPGDEQFDHVTTGEHAESTIEPFSEEGDSGSVICDDDIDDTECVNVIGLLTGAIFLKDGNWLYTYASHMKKTVDELEVQFNCVITPAHLEGPADLFGPDDGEGAVGNG